MITTSEAVDIAVEYGLTIMDAAGLLSLADDVAEAKWIASRFASTEVREASEEILRGMFSERGAAP